MSDIVVMLASRCKVVNVKYDTYYVPEYQRELYNRYREELSLPRITSSYDFHLRYDTEFEQKFSGNERDALMFLTNSYAGNNLIGSFDVVTNDQFEKFCEKLNEEDVLYAGWMAYRESVVPDEPDPVPGG